MPGGTVPQGFNGDFNTPPGTPASPQTIIAVRVPPVPNVFNVSYSADGTAFVFNVGYTWSNYIALGQYTQVAFNIWFVPASATNAATVASSVNSGLVYKNATLIQTIYAPQINGIATFTTNRFLTVDGWFWANAMGSTGNVSNPTRPYRSPAGQNLINLSIPPNCSGAAVSKTSPSVDGVTYSLVKASAVVPSDNTGVISVVMNAQGTGYKNDASTTVTFSGGLSAGGTAATGSAIVNPNGSIIGVQLSGSGNGYASPPSVVFGGAGSNAAATATLGRSTAFDGFQLYIAGYLGSAPQVEGPYVTAGGAVPGTTIFGTFYMVPDGAHTTTFTFVAVSRAGVRSTSGAPTATLVV